jgi:site-specific DNA-methyltransferase (adenine-specific)
MAISKKYLNKIICGDAVKVMKLLPDESIDLCITSPPYNLKNSTGNGMSVNTKTGKWAGNPLHNGYTDHSDDMPYPEYVSWQKDCITEMLRLIKSSGAIFCNQT